MNGIWKNMLKVYVISFKDFDKDEEIVQVHKKIVSLGRSFELELEEQDIQELIDVQDVELMAEDLIAPAEKKAEEEKETEEKPEQKFTTKKMAELFASIEQGMKLLCHMGVNLERFAKVERGIHDVLACYRVIYERKNALCKLQWMSSQENSSSATPFPDTFHHI